MARQFWQSAAHLSRRMHLVVLAAVVLAALNGAPAEAQGYKQLNADAAAGQLRGKAGAAVRQAGAPTPAQLADIDKFFNSYYFPTMTNTDPAQLGALAKLRKDLFVQYINAAKDAQMRTHLLNLSFKASGSISAGPYHPAARYNAALILGQLDQTPATGATPPTPLAAGTNALTALLERPDINGVPVPPAVKIAALVGLERHTRIRVDPQYSERITAAALAIATRKEPPADISDDVNGWMRRLAAQVLANQFVAGVTAPVHEVFVTLIGSKELNLDDRCEVARLLKPTMYRNVQGVDAGEMADALGRLAKAIFAGERAKAEKYQEELLGDPSAGGGFGGGGFDGGRGGGFGGRGGRGGRGGGYGGEFGGRDGFGGGFGGMAMGPQGPHFEKRRTLDRVMALIAGASAIADGGASDEVKQRMTALVTPLQEAADVISDDDTAELAVADAVVELAEQVNDIINGWAAGAEPAEGGDADAAEGGEFGDAEN